MSSDNTSEAYRKGFNSFTENIGRLINPHPKESSEHVDFERGWSQAFRRAPRSVINEYEKIIQKAEKEQEENTKRLLEIEKSAYAARKG